MFKKFKMRSSSKKNNWISLALYYNPDSYRTLVVKGINCYLEKNKDVFQAINLYCSDVRGYSLVFELELINNKDPEEIVKSALEHFESFFQNYPSDYVDLSEFENDWFLPYPNNSIIQLNCRERFNSVISLFEFELRPYFESYLNSLTKIILDLSNEIENQDHEENISSILFAISSIIHPFVNEKKEAHDLLNQITINIDKVADIMNSVSPSDKTKITDILSKLNYDFELNSSIINEFITLVWQELDSGNFSTLQELRNQSESLLRNYKELKQENNEFIETLLSFVINNIFSILGPNEYYLLFSFHSFKNSLISEASNDKK